MAARASFMTWIKQQWKLKPPLAHAHVKPRPGPEKGLVDSQGRPAGDPRAMLEIYREQWDGIWSGRVDSSADFRF
eukprot:8037294-Pyramimonas_sp.AAC.1